MCVWGNCCFFCSRTKTLGIEDPGMIPAGEGVGERKIGENCFWNSNLKIRIANSDSKSRGDRVYSCSLICTVYTAITNSVPECAKLTLLHNTIQLGGNSGCPVDVRFFNGKKESVPLSPALIQRMRAGVRICSKHTLPSISTDLCIYLLLSCHFPASYEVCVYAPLLSCHAR